MNISLTNQVFGNGQLHQLHVKNLERITSTFHNSFLNVVLKMSLRKSFVNHPETVVREIKPNFLEQIFFQTT